MIIRPCTMNYKKLREIPPGSVFKADNNYYLKINLVDGKNSVDLVNGSTRGFLEHLDVIPIKGEFIITKED